MPVLTASCKNYYGQYQAASLAAPSSCASVPGGNLQIYNENGALRCIVKPGKSDPSGHNNWDLIGKTTWTDDAKEVQKTYWTIDQPNIADPFTPYTDITYEAGDTLLLLAGGCGQSGGSGYTWKRYVDPSGDSSGPPNGEYFGVALLPSTDAPQQLTNPPPSVQELMNIKWVAYKNPIVSGTNFLTLGYVDDGYPNSTNGYGDNGYYAHDNGNNGQCTSSAPNSYVDGPAWVSLEVDHPLKPTTPPFSEGSKPFDVIFNQIEANALPWNPQWYYQQHSPLNEIPGITNLPDFNGICGSAFSTPSTYSAGNVLKDLGSAALGGVIAGPVGAIAGFIFGQDVASSTATTTDTTKLQAVCTSQPVTVDQFSATSTWGSAVLGLGGICPADPIRGHLNIQPVTYNGMVHFSDWSGVFPQDNDINMSLVPAAPNDDSSPLWGLTNGSNQMGTTKGSESYPYGGFLIEFDSVETVGKYFANEPEGTWWHAFAKGALAAGPGNAIAAAAGTGDYSSAVGIVNQLMGAPTSSFAVNGVVTGLMGIDGVHDNGISELHPAFSMAFHLLDRDVSTPTGKTEQWAFYIRNQGDEGNCSDQMHTLEPETYGTRDYYISLPWPSDSGKPAYESVTASIQAIPWVSGSSIEQTLETPGTGTYLHFLSPNYTAPAQVPFFGYDGVVTLQYSYEKSDKKSEPKDTHVAQVAVHEISSPPASETQSNDAEDFPWKKIMVSSPDPAIDVHLKKYFEETAATQITHTPLAQVTENTAVKIVGAKVMPHDAKLPMRTHQLADVTRERQNDELSRQAGYARQTFHAVDSQHVFYLDTDGVLRFTQGPFTSSSISADKVVDQDVLTFAAVSKDEVLKLDHEGSLFVETSPFDIDADGKCAQGYVWRDAYPNDHVCVTPGTRQETTVENAEGPSHINPLSFLLPGTCMPGYVWRLANTTDHVCVTPDVASQTAEDNVLGPTRVEGASLKKFFGWPVAKYQAMANNDMMILDANGKLSSVTAPFTTSTKPSLIAQNVRAFQAIDQTHTLVLSTDDRLQSYPVATRGSTPPKTYDKVWAFQQTADGSLFIVDQDDTLWSEPAHKQIDTNVRKMQAIDATTIFVLTADGTLSLRRTANTQLLSEINALVSTDIRDFQAIDAQTVYVLDQDGELWIEQGNFGPEVPTKILVAKNVR
jgi:hypothetical protein